VIVLNILLVLRDVQPSAKNNCLSVKGKRAVEIKVTSSNINDVYSTKRRIILREISLQQPRHQEYRTPASESTTIKTHHTGIIMYRSNRAIILNITVGYNPLACSAFRWSFRVNLVLSIHASTWSVGRLCLRRRFPIAEGGKEREEENEVSSVRMPSTSISPPSE
jgi:hypothetical protein